MIWAFIAVAIALLIGLAAAFFFNIKGFVYGYEKSTQDHQTLLDKSSTRVETLTTKLITALNNLIAKNERIIELCETIQMMGNTIQEYKRLLNEKDCETIQTMDNTIQEYDRLLNEKDITIAEQRSELNDWESGRKTRIEPPSEEF